MDADVASLYESVERLKLGKNLERAIVGIHLSQMAGIWFIKGLRPMGRKSKDGGKALLEMVAGLAELHESVGRHFAAEVIAWCV